MAYSKITQGQFVVRLDDINIHHELTAYAAIGFAQEAAWLASVEADISIPKLLEMGYTWILSRTCLKVYEMPKYAEVINYETYISTSEKFVSQRDGKFYRGDKLLFEVSTNWLFVDAIQKKLSRIPEHLTNALLNTEKTPIEAPNHRLADVENPDYQYNTTVRWHDLDLNNHTTNRQYIRWCLDALPKEVLDNERITQLDFQFKNETLIGENLNVLAAKADNGYIFKINSENGKEIVRGEVLTKS
jgi:acyl-ACP thioesterase